MDPGDYDTNTLLINDIASIAFRVYEPVFSSSAYTFAASDVERDLRKDGYLVYADGIRRGIWCFYLVGREGSNVPQTGPQSLGASLEVCGYKLNRVDEGGFEPIGLLKTRHATTGALNPRSSASPAGSIIEQQSSRSAQSPGSLSQQTWNTGPQDQEAKPDARGYSSVPVREIYGYFIKATLSSLSTAFCSVIGAIALNSRTFLLPPKAFASAEGTVGPHITKANLATIRVYLTTTGSLVMSLTISCVDGLMASADRIAANPMDSKVPVLVAPLGAFGTLQGVVDGAVGIAHCSPQSPEAQITSLRRDMDGSVGRYREDCLQLLRLRGIPLSLLEETSWVIIHSLRKRVSKQASEGKATPGGVHGVGSLCWPSVLCFHKAPRVCQQPGAPHTGVSGGFNEKSLDPLSFASSWLIGSEKRDSMLLKRQKEREAAVVASRQAGDKEGLAQTLSTYSPLALRRQSNSNAPPVPGAMYPTPPDGVQNPAAVAQYLEAAVSSPANNTSVAAVAPNDVDTVMTQAGGMGEAFTEGWDNADKRADTGYLEISGAMGSDIFGDNSITDADFNFFDDQPGGDMDFSNAAGDTSGTLDLTAPKLPSFEGVPQNSSTKPSIPTAIPPPVPVFAKPELRHARSSMMGNIRQANGETRARKQAAAGIKRVPSPFNANIVYKRVRASLSLQNLPKSPATAMSPMRRGSIYEKLGFDSSLAVNNSKYQENGKFGYRWDSKPPEKDAAHVSAPTTTSYFQRHGKKRAKLKEAPEQVGALVAKITGDLEASSLHQSPTKIDDQPSDDDLSLVSDVDDSSYTSDEPSSPTKSVATRRRLEDDANSMALSLRDLENMGAPSPQLPVDLSRFANEPLELPLAKYFAERQSVELQGSLTDEDFINTAQILTEQAASGLLRLTAPPLDSDFANSKETRRNLALYNRHCLQVLCSALPLSLRGVNESRFRGLVDLQDVPILGPPPRQQARPPGSVEQIRPSVFQIQPPQFELRRHETRLSLLPSCMDFWESLGLGPSQGPKDVHAVCVFPEKGGMSDHVDTFLNRMRNVYESLKLGTFERLPSNSSISEGLLSFEAEGSSVSVVESPGSLMPPQTTPVADQMGKLSQALAGAAVDRKNFVVYFIYNPTNPSSIVDCCAAFQRLYEFFKRILTDKRLSVTNELVMQLIPLDLVAAPSALAIPAPSEYVRLSLETYDRCTVCDGSMPMPAVILEQSLPRMIDFKLTGTSSTNVLHENSCMHVAYAQSVDERWITAAWTDNRGLKQMTASYCLGRRERPLTTSFANVAQEIWETTQEVISAWKVHWQIIISKCGPMEPHEIEVWTSLQQGEAKEPSTSLTLLAVDTDPSLHLIPPAVKIPLSAPTAFYTTPASTPQASVMSPDGNAPATPMGATGGTAVPTTPGAETTPAESDPDTILLDITDTTWGAVLSHRLNNAASVVELNPTLVSGYLVKRGGTRVEDPPVVMEVNVMYTEGNPRMYEALLREMLTYFRGLGSLARARGMVDRDTDIRPWHVAAAEKGVQVLYQLM
ncbi:hypothetical protein ACKVWC_006770 [Pyricularia oryzae]